MIKRLIALLSLAFALSIVPVFCQIGSEELHEAARHLGAMARLTEEYEALTDDAQVNMNVVIASKWDAPLEIRFDKGDVSTGAKTFRILLRSYVASQMLAENEELKKLAKEAK